MDTLNQSQRLESLEWLLETKGFESTADLTQVSSICTDFVLADLNAMVLQAAKIGARLLSTDTETHRPLTLSSEDFAKAHGEDSFFFLLSFLTKINVSKDFPGFQSKNSTTVEESEGFLSIYNHCI